MEAPLVFLSYARRQPDEGWAARVTGVCVQRFGLRVWFDKRGIRPGYDFDAEIAAAVEAASAFVFLGSTSSLTSPYCLAECNLARKLGKPFIPLFIEQIGWTGFPEDYRRLHFEQIYRAGDDEDLASMVGEALVRGGVAIDRARIPPRKQLFDQWSTSVHPSYGQVRRATEADLRAFVSDCSAKLGLRPEHGYHNLNLALLFLKLGDPRRAMTHAEAALRELPGRSEVFYYSALVAAAQAPVREAPRARIEHIMQLANDAIALEEEKGAAEGATAALPWALKAIIAHDYYAANGLTAPAGSATDLAGQAQRRPRDRHEVERLEDSLKGLSETSRRFVASLL